MSVALSWLTMFFAVTAVLTVLWLLLLAWVLYAYGSSIYRIFETKPLFVAHSVKPQPDGDEVAIPVTSSRQLRGTYFRHTASKRRGVLMFAHEFSANRWLFEPYIGFLREDGFDIFTFDFCNHGCSDKIEGYEPLQWVTSHEEQDVAAAIDYLKSREDKDPRGIGIFGVSKGGGAAIAAAAKDRFVRAIVTDGAFPTHSTVTFYEMRWCVIYVRLKSAYLWLPRFFWDLLTTGVVWVMCYKHKVKYLRLEPRIRRFGGRPLLMIHGEKDNYITEEIARRFFSFAGQPKEFWLVKKAKHNGCLDIDPVAYRNRVRKFFLTHFPVLETPAVQPEKTAVHDSGNSEQPEKLITSSTASD